MVELYQEPRAEIKQVSTIITRADVLILNFKMSLILTFELIISYYYNSDCMLCTHIIWDESSIKINAELPEYYVAMLYL